MKEKIRATINGDEYEGLDNIIGCIGETLKIANRDENLNNFTISITVDIPITMG